MGDFTNISWTLRTQNFWTGCKKVSPGCKHCYMFRDMERYGRDPNKVTKTKTWNNPKRWQLPLVGTDKKEMVFTCSWSDFFIRDADEWRKDAWKVIKDTPNLLYQILTKRPENIQSRLPDDWGEGYPNVALGVSVETKHYLWRVNYLRSIAAKWRFISAEPLLGSIKDINLDGMCWVIVGGESGGNFRPMKVEWAREVRDLCLARNISFFYKQGAATRPGQDDKLDGIAWKQWPAEWLNQPEPVGCGAPSSDLFFGEPETVAQ